MIRTRFCLAVAMLSSFCWGKEDIKDFTAHIKSVKGYDKKSHMDKLAYLGSLQKNQRLHRNKAYQACHEAAFYIYVAMLAEKKTGTEQLEVLQAIEKEFQKGGKLEGMYSRPSSDLEKAAFARHLYEDKGYADIGGLDRLKLVQASQTKYGVSWRVGTAYARATWLEILYSPKYTTEKLMELFAAANEAKLWNSVPRGLEFSQRFCFHLSNHLKTNADYQKATLDGKIQYIGKMKKDGLIANEDYVLTIVDGLIDAGGREDNAVPALGRLAAFGKCKASKVIGWGNYVSSKEKELLSDVLSTDPAYAKGDLAAKVKYVAALEDKRWISGFVKSDIEIELVITTMKADPGFAKMNKDQKKALFGTISKGVELEYRTKREVFEKLKLK